MSCPNHYKKGILVFQKLEVSVTSSLVLSIMFKEEAGLTITSAVQETVLG